MNKKRLIAALGAVAIVATLFAGCATKTPEQKPGETGKTGETPKSTVKVGLSTDEGGVNDKSFNQAADEGVKKAQKELGFDYKVVESKTKEDYESNLDALVAYGANLTFGVGFQMEQAITNAAKKHTNTKFAIIDAVVAQPNVNSYVFKEEEGSFLMGVIAGKMSKSGKIGFIGGKDFDLINKFEVGFAAGVKAVNPEAAKELASRKYVRYVDSFTDSAKGKEAAQQLLNAGCDVIYHAAGGVGEGMFQAIKESTAAGKKAWAIGVDKDQAAILPEYASIILSSMIKRVDTATYNASKAVAQGTFKGNEVTTLGLKEEGVGIAPTSKTNTPADVLTLVGKYETAVKEGKIKVPAKRDELANFTAPEIK